jgi:hypothetical protein
MAGKLLEPALRLAVGHVAGGAAAFQGLEVQEAGFIHGNPAIDLNQSSGGT